MPKSSINLDVLVWNYSKNKGSKAVFFMTVNGYFLNKLCKLHKFWISVSPHAKKGVIAPILNSDGEDSYSVKHLAEYPADIRKQMMVIYIVMFIFILSKSCQVYYWLFKGDFYSIWQPNKFSIISTSLMCLCTNGRALGRRSSMKILHKF